MGAFALWAGRKYFAGVVRRVLQGAPHPTGRSEPLSYQAAMAGIIIGIVGLVVFATNLLGIALPAAPLFLGGYLLLSLSITRMRAEFGLPIHDVFTGPLVMMVGIGGGRALGRRSLIGFSLLYWLVRIQRSHPMPHALEGLALGERRSLPAAGLYLAMSLAVVVGIVSAFWAMLHLAYTYGMIQPTTDARIMGVEAFTRAESWLTFPPLPDAGRLVGLLASAAFTLALLVTRQRFVWWPFHPVGYAASSQSFLGMLWLPMFVAWLVKSLMVRYWGHKLYKASIPFFIGMILGEFVMGSFWGIVGALGGCATYRFWAY